MERTTQNVLIIGGGASGTITAIALQRLGVAGESIDIAEPRALLGEGLAYATRDPLHRLNVPTSKMSAIWAAPEDFLEWTGMVPYSFAERRIYSTYLRDRLGAMVNHISDVVVDIEEKVDGTFAATFAAGEVRHYRKVVVAVGNGPARIPDFLKNTPPSPRIIIDVWDGTPLPEAQTIICFGTGLTFVDVSITHLARDPKNKVIAISGSGNLPERHFPSPVSLNTPAIEEVNTLEKLRAYLANAGSNYRQAVDSLRPITEDIWRGFTVAEREEFLRTDGSVWFKRRHRIATEVAENLDAQIAAGRISVISGKVSRVEVTEDSVSLILENGERYEGDYLALCIGRDYKLSDPLTSSLVSKGKTSRGPLDMGLSVDVSTGQLQHADGTTYKGVYALGPLRSGEAFESSAIPEISKQAWLIAERIKAELV